MTTASPPSPLVRILRVSALLLAALLAGCATDTPYDYGLGLQVIRMDEHTRDLLATRLSRPLPAVEGSRYIIESLGTLQLLHDRATAHRVDNPETNLVEYLRRRFQALAARKSPLTRTDVRRLAPAIADLREIESTKGNDWRGDPGAFAFSSDDGLDFTDDISYARRHGDHGDHRDHHDSDHRDHGHDDHGHDDHGHDDHGHHDDHGSNHDDHGHDDDNKHH